MDESKVIMKGRLGPGMMITADLLSGQVFCLSIQLEFLCFLICNAYCVSFVNIEKKKKKNLTGMSSIR